MHRLVGIVALCVVLCMATQSWADSISTDRPGNGNAPTVVPKLRPQIETSVLVARDTGGEFVTMPTFLRFGLPHNLEVRLGSGLVSFVAPEGGDSTVELADLIVGAKVEIATADGLTPNLGAVIDITLPTGGDLAGTNAAVPDARLAATWSLPSRFSVLINAGLDVPDDDQGRYLRFVYVANLGVSLSEKVSVFGEGFGRVDTSGDRSSIVQFDLGLAYQVSERLQLDVFSQHGVSEAAPDLQLALGFSALL